MTFTPIDGTNYRTVTITVIINVAQAAPQVSAKPVNLTFGTPLADNQLNGSATWTVGGTLFAVPGSWSFTSALGTVPHAGAGQSESASFTPTDGTDYLRVTITVIINVAQASPQASANPVNLTYGTPLANEQLSGSATWTVDGTVVVVPGSWSFTSDLGTVLNPGAGQSVPVTFTPTDKTDYRAVTTTATINVDYVPVVQVQSLKATTVRVSSSKGKRARTTTESALLLQFSGTLTGTGNPFAYQLFTGKTRRGVSTYNKYVPLTVVSFTRTSVTLVPTVKLNLSVPEQLRVTESDLVDAFGRLALWRPALQSHLWH